MKELPSTYMKTINNTNDALRMTYNETGVSFITF